MSTIRDFWIATLCITFWLTICIWIHEAGMLIESQIKVNQIVIAEHQKGGSGK